MFGIGGDRVQSGIQLAGLESSMESFIGISLAGTIYRIGLDRSKSTLSTLGILSRIIWIDPRDRVDFPKMPEME